MNKKIEKILNGQIAAELLSSNLYLSMASWAENHGFNGVSQFLYRHADEERMHMLKLIKFVNERGGKAVIPASPAPKADFESVEQLFTLLLKHEMEVTNSINKVVYTCLEEKDYTTHNFMQWYVAEQLEEEALARNILDKLKIIGKEKSGLYMFDSDLEKLIQAAPANTAG